MNVTGDIFCTGNTLIKGNISITGNHSQTGGFFLNTNDSNVIITGAGSNHKFSVIAPMVFLGAISHSGDLNSTGTFFHKGDFSNSGNSTIFGNETVTGNFAASKVFATGITTTGTSSTPALIVQPNSTTSPSGGAIEYSKNCFSLTTESTGSPSRSIVNQTFSYIAPQNFYAATPAANVTTPLLGNTGVYLNTGRYHIKYDVRFSKGTTARNISLGITGNFITDRIGSLTSSTAIATTTFNKTGFFGTANTDNIFVTGTILDININAVNFYSFDATVTITGLTKIRPIFRIPNAEAITGSAFAMEITQLATGTGVGLAGANGPWSDA